MERHQQCLRRKMDCLWWRFSTTEQLSYHLIFKSVKLQIVHLNYKCVNSGQIKGLLVHVRFVNWVKLFFILFYCLQKSCQTDGLKLRKVSKWQQKAPPPFPPAVSGLREGYTTICVPVVLGTEKFRLSSREKSTGTAS